MRTAGGGEEKGPRTPSDRPNGYYRIKSDSARDPYAAAHRICEGAEPTALSHIRDVSKSSQHDGHGKSAHNLTRVSTSGDSISLSQRCSIATIFVLILYSIAARTCKGCK
jgi:hypothetical protein